MSDKMREALLPFANLANGYDDAIDSDDRPVGPVALKFCRAARAALAPSRPVTAGAAVAWVVFADNGNCRIWFAKHADAEKYAQAHADEVGFKLTPLYTAPPSVVDFLMEWTGPDVINVSRPMLTEWQKRYGWDKGEHEGCGRDSERAFKTFQAQAAQPASPAAGRDEIARIIYERSPFEERETALRTADLILAALSPQTRGTDRGNYEDRHPNDLVLHPLSEIREWDEALAVLGIQDSDQTPADAIRQLNAEIERLHGVSPQDGQPEEITKAEMDAIEDAAIAGKPLSATPPAPGADRTAVIEELAQDFEQSAHHVWDKDEVADRIRALAPKGGA